jgi:glucose/arabinose dehydrogenase
MSALFTHRLGPVVAVACAALLTPACGDDETITSPGTAGNAGNPSVGGGGSGAAAGSAGAPAGSGGAGVVPDPLKNCEAPSSPSVPALKLTQVVTGLDNPVYLTQPRTDDGRLFVVEQTGRIRLVVAGALVQAPFLDLSSKVQTGGEKGLLGLAFHPDYAQNGRFFVFYSTLVNGALTSRVAQYSVAGDNADQADPNSERVLLEVAKPQENHNGGDLVFGPDGFLYIGFGDGGGGGDQHGTIGNGQNLDTYLGKILRIDVDGSSDTAAYAVPPGNITDPAARREIWSYGLRNPWRFSFDACTGDMYIADVGQGTLEEVDFEPANTSGRNYGWRLMEGTNCFNPASGCDASAQNLVLPVATYGRDAGQSITGGYVYRGQGIPTLRGTYLYADYQSAAFFALRMAGGALAQPPQDISDNLNPGRDVAQISSFGQDNAGELYVLSLSGSVFRIDAE